MKFGLTILLAGVCLGAGAYDDVVIFPRERGTKINRFFYDFKSPAAPRKFVQGNWARTLLKDYGFSGIRTSIYGTGKRPAHPEPGVVLEEFYEPETRGLKLAKKIRPDVIIFASKKLDGTDSFPAWTKNADGIIPEKYAVLIADYLDYMKREGLEVDVLGIDNERRFNEGNLMPDKHRAVVEALRRLTKERGLKMPRVIGHEDFAMGRDQWMEKFQSEGGDTMDIFGGHYYPQWRQLDRLKADLKLAGQREKWHTELHWDSKPEDDPLLLATKAYLALWDCTDNGMNAFMWWDFNPLKNRRDYLMHAVTVPLVGAWPVRVTDPDGPETTDEKKLHTRAFLQGDRLTVFAVNYNGKKEWDNLRFMVKGGRIAGDVEGRQWSEGSPKEGRAGKVKTFAGISFKVDLPPRTVNVFSFRVRR